MCDLTDGSYNVLPPPLAQLLATASTIFFCQETHGFWIPSLSVSLLLPPTTNLFFFPAITDFCSLSINGFIDSLCSKLEERSSGITYLVMEKKVEEQIIEVELQRHSENGKNNHTIKTQLHLGFIPSKDGGSFREGMRRSLAMLFLDGSSGLYALCLSLWLFFTNGVRNV